MQKKVLKKLQLKQQKKKNKRKEQKKLNKIMFSRFFKKKTDLEKLEEEHKALLSKAYSTASTNRTLSDSYMLKASEIDKKIESIIKHSNK